VDYGLDSQHAAGFNRHYHSRHGNPAFERTMAAVQWWPKLCITASWFENLSNGIYAYEDPENWKVVGVTCKEENSQTFAGQHAMTSTFWYLFDEASIVPDGIWKVAYGGLTDGEPMFFAWGHPERNTGHFFEICFGRERDRWNHRRVDSRNSWFTNKTLIEEWRRDYGERFGLVPCPCTGVAASPWKDAVGTPRCSQSIASCSTSTTWTAALANGWFAFWKRFTFCWRSNYLRWWSGWISAGLRALWPRNIRCTSRQGFLKATVEIRPLRGLETAFRRWTIWGRFFRFPSGCRPWKRMRAAT